MRVPIWIMLVLAIAAIVVGSLASGAVRWPPGISPSVTHLLAYTLLGALMALAIGTSLRGLLLAFALTAAIGTGLEFLQLAVPVREFSFYDLGMNVVGAAMGVAMGGGLARGMSRFMI